VVYISADDYGLCDVASTHIQQCIDCDAINKVSVFPNLEQVDPKRITESKNVRLSLHLNLVEGKCMAKPSEVPLLADKYGNLKHSFTGLLKLGLFHPKEFSKQVYREIKAQVLFWKSLLPEAALFCVDGHQHTHMIPSVFNALLRVLEEEKVNLDYIRIPCEPLLPYIKTPSLYFTYNPINVAKQWLLNFLWRLNKHKGQKLHTALFFGILFSGRMDERRVLRILPKYEKLAQKRGMDIEVLFHPGYLDVNDSFTGKNIAFSKFYLSGNRKTEFDSVMKMRKKAR